jgi:hypothetical protein
MTDARTQLKQKLESDPNARAKFMDGVKDLLQKQGMPTDDETLKQLGFKELDVQSANFVKESAMSSFVITITA